MSLKREYEVLRRVPIFAGIEPAKLKLLAFMCERVGFDPGNRLMRQGDPADAAYLIIDGHAEVMREFPIIAVSIMQGLAQRLGRRKGNCSE
jgi:signal-transduction protein with cAMP-binding, CBS, and nucleotidyltransferase domain